MKMKLIICCWLKFWIHVVHTFCCCLYSAHSSCFSLLYSLTLSFLLFLSQYPICSTRILSFYRFLFEFLPSSFASLEYSQMTERVMPSSPPRSNPNCQLLDDSSPRNWSCSRPSYAPSFPSLSPLNHQGATGMPSDFQGIP